MVSQSDPLGVIESLLYVDAAPQNAQSSRDGVDKRRELKSLQNFEGSSQVVRYFLLLVDLDTSLLISVSISRPPGCVVSETTK